MKQLCKKSALFLFILAIGTFFNSCTTEETETLSLESESEALLTISSTQIVALQNVFSDLYVSSENGQDATCNREAVGRWERITMIT